MQLSEGATASRLHPKIISKWRTWPHAYQILCWPQDDVNQFFDDVLPYHAFSLRVAQADIPRLDVILKAVPDWEIAHLQVMTAKSLAEIIIDGRGK